MHFVLGGHPMARLDGEYLITGAAAVVLQRRRNAGGAEKPFSCHFTAIPLKTPFRPPQITPPGKQADVILLRTDRMNVTPLNDPATAVVAGMDTGNVDTVLIGDSPFDVATARSGGLGFVGVTTGTHNADELKIAGAGRIAADLAGVARELGV